MPEVEKEIKEPEMPSMDDEDQLSAYVYFKVWENVLLNMFPVNESFDEEFIKVAVDGFRDETTNVELLKFVDGEFVEVKNDYVGC